MQEFESGINRQTFFDIQKNKSREFDNSNCITEINQISTRTKSLSRSNKNVTTLIIL